MDSVREQIVKAMCDALNTPTDKPATTYRTRTDFIAEGELPAMVLYVVKDDVVQKSATVVLHTSTVRLEMVVAGEPPADVAIDPLYVYAMKTVADDTIWKWRDAGIRSIQEKGLMFETEASYQDATAAVLDFEIVFVAKADDPTVKVMA